MNKQVVAPAINRGANLPSLSTTQDENNSIGEQQESLVAMELNRLETLHHIPDYQATHDSFLKLLSEVKPEDGAPDQR